MPWLQRRPIWVRAGIPDRNARGVGLAAAGSLLEDSLGLFGRVGVAEAGDFLLGLRDRLLQGPVEFSSWWNGERGEL